MCLYACMWFIRVNSCANKDFHAYPRENLSSILPTLLLSFFFVFFFSLCALCMANAPCFFLKSVIFIFTWNHFSDKGCRFNYPWRCSGVNALSCDIGLFSILLCWVLFPLHHRWTHSLVLCICVLISFQGNHPEDGQPVIIKVARVGFAVRHRRTIASVPKVYKVMELKYELGL